MYLRVSWMNLFSHHHSSSITSTLYSRPKYLTSPCLFFFLTILIFYFWGNFYLCSWQINEILKSSKSESISELINIKNYHTIEVNNKHLHLLCQDDKSKFTTKIMDFFFPFMACQIKKYNKITSTRSPVH